MPKKGYKQTKEHRRNRSKATKGKLKGEKNPMYGKHHSKETRAEMSRVRQGEKPSKETREKLSKAHQGMKHSKETIEKLSGEANHSFGKHPSKETREKLRKAILGKKHSEKTRALLRKIRAKRIMPTKDTSIEVKIQDFLKELRVPFFTHQYISQIEHGYQCDIFIPSKNLVIECDGDYWHHYPTGNAIDHVRTAELIKSGFDVLRLWEHEIRAMDVDEFKKRLCVII